MLSIPQAGGWEGRQTLSLWVQTADQCACPQWTHSQRERLFTSWGKAAECGHIASLWATSQKNTENLAPSFGGIFAPLPHSEPKQRLGSDYPGSRLFSNSKVHTPYKGNGAKCSTGTRRKIRKCRWWKTPVSRWLPRRNLEGWRRVEHQSGGFRTFVQAQGQLLSDCTTQRPPRRARCPFWGVEATLLGLCWASRGQGAVPFVGEIHTESTWESESPHVV